MNAAPTQPRRIWVTACCVVACVFSFASHGTSQEITCDADLLPPLPIPDLRISAPKAELRVAPESDGKVVITLPQDADVPVLGRHNGWFVVNYRNENRYRRLYLSADAAEFPPTTLHPPGRIAAQRWSDSHSRICGKIWRARTATQSFAAGALLAGVGALVWHVFVDDEIRNADGDFELVEETSGHYRPVMAVWAALSVGAMVGAVYQGIRLWKANDELGELGWPRLNNGGVPLRGLGGARGDLLLDAATGRQGVLVTWQH